MRFEVLVVLGCRVQDGKLIQASLRRVEQAARTYHEAGAGLVIASGGKAWQGSLEAEVFARGLEARGVPRACLVEERASLTTRGNAQGVRQLLQGREPRALGVVTCDWHMPRALELFRRFGLSPIPVPAPSPPRPLRERLLRAARERGSLALDGVLLRVWTRP